MSDAIPIINPTIDLMPIDWDAERASAKDLPQASIPLTPEMSAFLNKWKTTQMNNKRVAQILQSGTTSA